MEVVASLSQGRTTAAQCGLFTHKSVPGIFEPPCICTYLRFNRLVRGSDSSASNGGTASEQRNVKDGRGMNSKLVFSTSPALVWRY